jgi:acetyl-CoA acetyltransferase
MPQGISADLIATKYGFSRDDVDAYAVESQKRADAAWKDGRFKNSVIPVKDQNGMTILDHDEHMRPSTDMQSLASLNPSFVMPGEMGGFDAVAVQRYPEIEASTTSTMPAIRPASSMAPPPCCSAPRRPARPWGSSPARASRPSPISVRSPPSC